MSAEPYFPDSFSPLFTQILPTRNAASAPPQGSPGDCSGGAAAAADDDDDDGEGGGGSDAAGGSSLPSLTQAGLTHRDLPTTLPFKMTFKKKVSLLV